MGVKLGLDAKLYRNTGTPGAPTWVELTNVKDLTLNLDASEADVTTRGNAGWRATLAALKDASIEFEMVWDTADAAFTAIKDAFFGSTSVEFAVMDGDITIAGAQGLRAEMSITNFSRSEPLEEAISVSVTAKPTYATTAPSRMTVP
jgi:TP901-1 family phage major tail protein